ncbi:ExbD/TolR family protein [Frigidibacter sp. ROC022]|uniref:ExbD/TolR family protein n=1 Tax=Frigidibacter sp. ROC022 TaxID=2971796 RepID=UPI00215AB1F7|nr:biopolymer transporter ExbD [Frigidibacter sp. ROC022]MCR8723319.1 biopolymer transporter ExbD [Frigidibacter sp. ROC022]
MKLRRAEPKPQPETIVALIDVVFFLLVFFILVGRMDATAPFDVIPPTGLTGQDLPAGGLTVAVDSDGRYAIDNVLMSRDEVLTLAAGRIAEDPDLLFRINADRETALRFVLPLVSELEAAGAREVVLVVTPNPPKTAR